MRNGGWFGVRGRDSLADRAAAALGLTRRQFMNRMAGLAALGLVDPLTLAHAALPDNRRLSWLAYRTAEAEGSWDLTRVEGTIPRELNGTLYRVGPGEKENHGVALQHFFDGDAFITAFDFREGRVRLSARFIETPERVEEQAAGRMIYNEFGTLAPVDPADPASRSATDPGRSAKSGGAPLDLASLKLKNQPSVNVIPWDGRLLGLSEGGHPSAIDPVTLGFQGYWDFKGTLPKSAPFTAHPKYDPATGEAYAYGTRQGFPPALLVWKMLADGTLEQLHEIRTPTFYMIHDMLLSKEHIVFAIPPVKLNPMQLLSGKDSLADALRFFEKEPARVTILRRDGGEESVTVELPPGLVFHHGNARTEGRRVTLDTMLSEGGETLKAIHSFAKEEMPGTPPAILTRLVIDLDEKRVVSREEIDVDQEFPRFDIRRLGGEARYLHTMESGLVGDDFAFTHLVRTDLEGRRALRVGVGAGHCLGEAIFVPRPGSTEESDGWMMVQGYDANADKTYLEIRDAATLELVSRIHAPVHLPLGFHGNFVPDAHVGGV